MTEWDIERRPVRKGYPRGLVEMHCVNNPTWQRFRLALKGKPTEMKLKLLEQWYDGQQGGSERMSKHQREVQVGNYLGALRRGGQLDEDNRIKRAL